MSQPSAININLLASERVSFWKQPRLWILGLVLLFLVSGYGLDIYQHRRLKQQELINTQLKEQLDLQNQTISGFKFSPNSEQMIIDKHRRIRDLVDTTRYHADMMSKIIKTLPSQIIVKTIDISGSTIIISGSCTDYDQFAMMLDNIDATASMEISQTECTQSTSNGEIDFVVEMEWTII